MNELQNIKVIDNYYFDVFANKRYSEEFLNRLCDKFLNQRKKILDFFTCQIILNYLLIANYLIKPTLWSLN